MSWNWGIRASALAATSGGVVEVMFKSDMGYNVSVVLSLTWN